MPTDTSALRKLAADLQAAPARVRHDVEGVLDDTAEAIAARARTLVPVETGETRASIRAGGSGMERSVSVAGAAQFLEFGTSRMSPRPFLTPATDAEVPRLTADLDRALGDIL